MIALIKKGHQLDGCKTGTKNIAGRAEKPDRFAAELKEARAPVELDQQAVGRLSRMDALQKQNMELATEQRRQQRLHVIDAALKRIDAGDFGFCVICDEAISPQRLAFDPAVACCVTCRN